MLVVQTRKELAGTRLASSLVFAHGVWLNVVVRDGLVLDTRFAPAARGAPRPGRCFLLLHRGRVTFPGLVTFEGPCAIAMTEEDLEGAHGRRPRTYRSEGSPYAAVELHVRGEDAHLSNADDAPRPVPLEDDVWDAVARVLEDDAPTEARLLATIPAMLDALARAGVVSRNVPQAASSPLPFERLLRAVRPIAERFAVSATMSDLETLARVSNRQLDRYLRHFFATYPLVGGGFRASTVHLRLKLAVLFLSAEGTTVTEVVRAVGYGSTAALARAFRDAGLPPPGDVQEALQARP